MAPSSLLRTATHIFDLRTKLLYVERWLTSRLMGHDDTPMASRLILDQEDLPQTQQDAATGPDDSLLANGKRAVSDRLAGRTLRPEVPLDERRIQQAELLQVLLSGATLGRDRAQPE